MIMRGTSSYCGGPVPLLATGPAVKMRPRLVRRHGMGVLDYYDLMAQANLQNCAPTDSACVADNVAKQAAVEDFWAANQATGVPEGTKLTFSPLTPAQVIGFAPPDARTSPGNIVPTGIMQVSVPAGAPTPKSPAPPPQQVVNPSPSTQSTTTGSSATSTGSAVSQANGGTFLTDLASTVGGFISGTNQTTTGTDWISGIPNPVVVIAGLAAVLLLFGRGK